MLSAHWLPSRLLFVWNAGGCCFIGMLEVEPAQLYVIVLLLEKGSKELHQAVCLQAEASVSPYCMTFYTFI